VRELRRAAAERIVAEKGLGGIRRRL